MKSGSEQVLVTFYRPHSIRSIRNLRAINFKRCKSINKLKQHCITSIPCLGFYLHTPVGCNNSNTWLVIEDVLQLINIFHIPPWLSLRKLQDGVRGWEVGMRSKATLRCAARVRLICTTGPLVHAGIASGR
ncbi:hypothetical protein CAPTEDRAFT_191610 [Capitella teleta]|uniref:Uncharacterized protein n=1 Tax=Capitella teleta TaxID=283909 RepID=R7UTD9_CAPTE|nr:hypothetical protein CAPTEDRAFT_191610 [Capitella teleta]|eukprot:ELU09779.1 hypothetical protein CAPTEDRAFT_191610 [Capitella teleta]